MAGNEILERLMRVPAGESNRPVLTAGGRAWSYGELREGMLACAGWLASTHGIGRGNKIALCLPKTLETIQTIFAILALGAAYVPLPFQGPTSRLRRILASLQPDLVLTNREVAPAIRANALLDGSRIVALDEGGRRLHDLCRGIAPRRALTEIAGDDLALIFFTSGSTGEPKGVMWSQRGMAAALTALPRWRRQRADDRLITMAPLQYSASAEIFYPLLSGASLYVCTEQEALFADRLVEILERERITVWSATATALRLLVEGGDLAARDLRQLRRVELYGERMPLAALRAAMAALPAASFNNLYAASEAFDMLEYEIPRPLPETLTMLPLGWPAPHCLAELRDEAGAVVTSAGEVGEICVSGPRVFAGYWNDPVQSQARRVPGLADSYRTGDLAMRDAEGLYHFVGRKDHQVKLRGHRLDLGEIEATAKGEPRLREAVAMAFGHATDASAIGLAVLTERGTDEADLRAALGRLFAERLPRFAWPGQVIVLHEFPLLASGKIDRKAIERLVGVAPGAKE